MEVNPEDITDEYLNDLQNTKINRISIGAQLLMTNIYYF